MIKISCPYCYSYNLKKDKLFSTCKKCGLIFSNSDGKTKVYDHNYVVKVKYFDEDSFKLKDSD